MPKKPRKAGPGKFEGNAYPELAEILYAMSLDGCDYEAGDVTTVGEFGCLLNGPMGRDVLNTAKEAGAKLSKVERNVAQKAKCALVTEDERGFVQVDFSTKKVKCNKWEDRLQRLNESMEE